MNVASLICAGGVQLLDAPLCRPEDLMTVQDMSLLLPRCGLCSPCQCSICEELLPIFAFLLTSKALYSRCLADWIKALERVQKYARSLQEYLEVFVLTVRWSTCDSCVDVGVLCVYCACVLCMCVVCIVCVVCCVVYCAFVCCVLCVCVLHVYV